MSSSPAATCARLMVVAPVADVSFARRQSRRTPQRVHHDTVRDPLVGVAVQPPEVGQLDVDSVRPAVRAPCRQLPAQRKLDIHSAAIMQWLSCVSGCGIPPVSGRGIVRFMNAPPPSRAEYCCELLSILKAHDTPEEGQRDHTGDGARVVRHAD
jgi:hypothetical protein